MIFVVQFIQGIILLFIIVVNAESTQSTPHTVDSSTLITTAEVSPDSTETCKNLQHDVNISITILINRKMYKNPNYPIFNFQSAIIVCLVVPPVHGPATNGLVLVGMVKTIAIKIGLVMIVVPRFQGKSKIIVSFRVTVALAIKKVANYFLPYYVTRCHNLL